MKKYSEALSLKTQYLLMLVAYGQVYAGGGNENLRKQMRAHIEELAQGVLLEQRLQDAAGG